MCRLAYHSMAGIAVPVAGKLPQATNSPREDAEGAEGAETDFNAELAEAAERFSKRTRASLERFLKSLGVLRLLCV